MAAKDSDTIVTGRDSGHPVRQLKNRFSRDARAAEKNASKGIESDIEVQLAGSLARAVHGDVVTGSIMSGEVASLVNDEKSAAQIIDDIMAEAEALGALKLAELAAHNATHTHIPFREGE
jgi:enoyl-[acyl-carrier protein] reductase II